MHIHIPTHARFSCLACGRCCRTTAISLSPGEAERLKKLPAPRKESPTVQRYRGAMGEGHRILPRPDGSCPYLRDDNLCHIHAEQGLNAKPLACRLFPMSFVRTPEGIRVPLRFSCPAVAAGIGTPLSKQEDDLIPLARQVEEVVRIDSVGELVPFDRRRSISFADAAKIRDHLLRLQDANPTLFLSHAAASVEFMGLVAVSSLDAGTRFRYWKGLRDGLAAKAKTSPLLSPEPPTGFEKIFFRQTAFGLASLTNPGALRAGFIRNLGFRLGRSFRGLSYMFGRGTLGHAPLHSSIDAVLQEAGEKGRRDTYPASPLWRFFHNQIETHAFHVDHSLGGTVHEGFQVLALGLPFGIWFARASAGNERPGFADVVEGVVRLADAMSTPSAFQRLGSGLSGRIFRRERSWKRLAAWATGTEPGDPIRFGRPD